MRAELSALKESYVDVVLNNRYPADMSVIECLDIYETFHHMERKATWGAIPWPCSCTASHADCACKHGALLTAVFDPKNRILRHYLALPYPMPLDLLEEPCQDQNNDADFELPDQDALNDTVLAGLSKERDNDVDAKLVADAEAISVTGYSG